MPFYFQQFTQWYDCKNPRHPHPDRQKALQSLLLDPVITDMDVARQILDDYLVTYREYLPQFWKEKVILA